VLLVDAIREACASVAAEARSVAVDREALDRCADTLVVEQPAAADVPGESRDERAAFVVTLGTINFGSGWWPTITKRPSMSGYRTIEAGLADRFRRDGPWSAAELARIGPAAVAETLGQSPTHELMALYAWALADVGERVERRFGGSFARLVDAADGSATSLSELLAAWPSFLDVSVYRGRSTPFFKRAQLIAADLVYAGVARFEDLDRLTLFADNLVPHVLRVDGVLRYDEALATRIDSEKPIEHGSPDEVEIRACAVTAVEWLAERSGLSPVVLDGLLWRRGQAPEYKARPRHRARCAAY
jgi:putative queuosine salvage protein